MENIDAKELQQRQTGNDKIEKENLPQIEKDLPQQSKWGLWLQS